MGPRSATEQRTIVVLFVIVAAALVWATLWVPLTRDTAALKVARGTSAAALEEARERAKEASELSRKGATVATLDPRAELDRLLAQHDARSALTSNDWRDGRAQLVFAAINYDRLIALLEALQRDARLRIVEATITGRVEPGIVRAELTLRR